jgi:hypothetical protein
MHKRAGLNPQYLLLPTVPHTSVFITLEQPSLYMAKHVCIFVSSVGGRRFERIRSRTHVCDSAPFSNSALVSTRHFNFLTEFGRLLFLFICDDTNN